MYVTGTLICCLNMVTTFILWKHFILVSFYYVHHLALQQKTANHPTVTVGLMIVCSVPDKLNQEGQRTDGDVVPSTGVYLYTAEWAGSIMQESWTVLERSMRTVNITRKKKHFKKCRQSENKVLQKKNNSDLKIQCEHKQHLSVREIYHTAWKHTTLVVLFSSENPVCQYQ